MIVADDLVRRSQVSVVDAILSNFKAYKTSKLSRNVAQWYIVFTGVKVTPVVFSLIRFAVGLIPYKSMATHAVQIKMFQPFSLQLKISKRYLLASRHVSSSGGLITQRHNLFCPPSMRSTIAKAWNCFEPISLYRAGMTSVFTDRPRSLLHTSTNWPTVEWSLTVIMYHRFVLLLGPLSWLENTRSI